MDRRTFIKSSTMPLPTWIPYIPLTGLTVWGIHEVMMWINPPFDGLFDIIMHILLSLSKLATMFSFPIALRFVYFRLYRNRKNALYLSSSLIVFYGVCFLSFIYFIRFPLAEIMSGEALRLYYLDDSSLLANMHYLYRDEWLIAWNHFIPQFKEIGMATIWIIAIVLPGLYCKEWIRYPVVIFLFFFTIIAPIMLKLSIWDYDFFLGGIFFDILSIEFYVFYWSSSGSVVLFGLAFLIYLLFAIFIRLASEPVILSTENRPETKQD